MNTTATLDFDQFTLTPDQQTALDAFQVFLVDPIETVFVLSGYSGCGKSTLVRTILDRLPGFQKIVHLVDPTAQILEPVLTATTNKAAENLAQITGQDARTIHSVLGLRVSTDFRTSVTTLTVQRNAPLVEDTLLFIDEASYIDKALLQHIFQRTRNCKIVFIGDPAQLTPVQATGTPVFDANFPGAALTQVVRQAEGNPIVDLSTKFRHAVNTGKFFSFRPDGRTIQHLDREAFNQAIAQEFVREDWRYADSKILAWTNKCVVGYNQMVRNLAKGDPHFQEGDYVTVNTFLQTARGSSFKTDQLAQLTQIEPDSVSLDVVGNWVTLDHHARVFHPRSLIEKNQAIKQARQEGRINDVATMETSWADLRAVYAQTINKSQGSTYGSVFIDLDDIRRCSSGDQIARMMYVAVSRAKHQVFLTGDLA